MGYPVSALSFSGLAASDLFKPPKASQEEPNDLTQSSPLPKLSKHDSVVPDRLSSSNLGVPAASKAPPLKKQFNASTSFKQRPNSSIIGSLGKPIDSLFSQTDKSKEKVEDAFNSLDRLLDKIRSDYETNLDYLNHAKGLASDTQKWAEKLNGVVQPVVDGSSSELVEKVAGASDLVCDLIKPGKPVVNLIIDLVKLFVVFQAKNALKSIQKKCDAAPSQTDKKKLRQQRIEETRDDLVDYQAEIKRKIKKSQISLAKQVVYHGLSYPFSGWLEIKQSVVKKALKKIFDIFESLQSWKHINHAIYIQKEQQTGLRPSLIEKPEEIEKRQRKLNEFISFLDKSESFSEFKEKLKSINVYIERDIDVSIRNLNKFVFSLKKCKSVNEIQQRLANLSSVDSSAISLSLLNGLSEKLKQSISPQLNERQQLDLMQNHLSNFEINRHAYRKLSYWKKRLQNDEFKSRLGDQYQNTHGLIKLANVSKLLEKRQQAFKKDVDSFQIRLDLFFIENEQKNFAFIQQALKDSFQLSLSEKEWTNKKPATKPLLLTKDKWDAAPPRLGLLKLHLAEQYVRRVEERAIMTEKSSRVQALQKIELEKKPLQIARFTEMIEMAITTAQIVLTIPYVSGFAAFYLSKLAFSKTLLSNLSFELNFPGTGLLYLLFSDLETTVGGLAKQAGMALVGYLLLKSLKPNTYSLEAYKITLELNWIKLVSGIQNCFSLIKKIILQVRVQMANARIRHSQGLTANDAYYHELQQRLEKLLAEQDIWLDRQYQKIDKLEDQLQDLGLKDFNRSIEPAAKQRVKEINHLVADFIKKLAKGGQLSNQESANLLKQLKKNDDIEKAFILAKTAQEKAKANYAKEDHAFDKSFDDLLKDEPYAEVLLTINQKQNQYAYQKKYQSQPFNPIHDLGESIDKLKQDLARPQKSSNGPVMNLISDCCSELVNCYRENFGFDPLQEESSTVETNLKANFSANSEESVRAYQAARLDFIMRA